MEEENQLHELSPNLYVHLSVHGRACSINKRNTYISVKLICTVAVSLAMEEPVLVGKAVVGFCFFYSFGSLLFLGGLPPSSQINTHGILFLLMSSRPYHGLLLTSFS